MCYSAIAVANYFIHLAKEKKQSVSNMHLQKMVFFAHAAYSKQTGTPLVSDAVVAWQHGPVIETLYHSLKKYGNDSVTQEISVLKAFDEKKMFPCRFVIPTVPSSDKDIVDYLNNVWDKLSSIDTWRLRALSHAAGGAWYATVSKLGINPLNDNEVASKLPRNLTILDSVIMECGR